MDTKTYTTAEAASKIGVSRQTLYSWIEGRRVPAPKPIRTGRSTIRLWTTSEIEQVRKFKGTLKRGPKPKKR